MSFSLFATRPHSRPAAGHRRHVVDERDCNFGPAYRRCLLARGACKGVLDGAIPKAFIAVPQVTMSPPFLLSFLNGTIAAPSLPARWMCSVLLLEGGGLCAKRTSSSSLGWSARAGGHLAYEVPSKKAQ